MLAIKNFFKTILYKPLYNILMFFVWLVPGHNVGWAIIILTIIVRLALLPSSNKAVHSQKKMRQLQPEILKIQEKYKDDKQAQAKATLELYKTHKVSPFGSCLPLLIQLPILIVLYRVFIVGLNVGRFDMLYSFMPRPETINTIFLGIDLAKPEKIILPILVGITQFIQTKQITPTLPKGKTNDFSSMLTKQMIYIMPLFSVFISMSLPAALPLYWLVTTVFSIVQQWIILRGEKTAAITISVKQKGE